MQRKFRFLLCSSIFVIASVYFASTGNAFNTFKSAQEESNNLNESANAMRELRDVNMQILEQLKLMNQQLSNLRGVGAQAQSPAQIQPNSAPVPISPPLIRANPY